MINLYNNEGLEKRMNSLFYQPRFIISMICLLVLPSLSIAQNFAAIEQKPESSATTADASLNTTHQPLTIAQQRFQVAQQYAKDQVSRYTLGDTDVIDILVQRHPEVSGKYIINAEGKIQLEFVGDIMLGGLTKEDAAKTIAKSLETYIINPDVSVKILEYNSKVVYVVGEVGAPGKIVMRGDTITVRDALLLANLPQLTAATDMATLFTPNDTGHVVEKRVNVKSLLYKGDLRENYVMKPGDTLYLPATLWAKFARFINPIAQPVGSAAGTAGTAGGF